MDNTPHDINCANCGAPIEIPATGNSVACSYCGTRNYLPQSLVSTAPEPESAPAQTLDPEQKKRIVRWVWIIVGIVVAVTVIPTVCSIVIGICASFFAILAAWFS